MPPRTTCKLTTDHDEIRRWAQERSAVPAAVPEAERAESLSRLRLKLPGRNDGVSMKEMSWEVWLKKFDQHKLAFLYQEQIANGEASNYNEIVSREVADKVESAVGGKGRSASRRRGSSREKQPIVVPGRSAGNGRANAHGSPAGQRSSSVEGRQISGANERPARVGNSRGTRVRQELKLEVE